MEKYLLCVDDEEHILKSLERNLRKESYKILLTSDIEQAISWLKNYNIEVVLSDYRMQTMTGIEFLKIVKKIKPNTIRVILSGFAEEKIINEALHNGEIYKYLLKPWSPENLKKIITECFDQYNIEKAA